MIHMRSRFFLIFYVLGIVSCQNDVLQKEFKACLRDAIQIDDVIQKEIDCKEVANPTAMLVFDDNLIIADDSKDGMIHSYNLLDGTHNCSYRKGRSSNELLEVRQLQNKGTDSFFIFDSFASKVHIAQKNQSGAFEEYDSMDVDGYLSLCISDSIVFGCCIGSDKRFKLMDMTTGESKEFGSFDPFGVPPAEGKILLQGNVAYNPAIRRFMAFSFYGITWQSGSIDESEPDSPTIVAMPLFDTSYQGTPAFKKETTIGFVSVASTPEIIYGLYSGSILEDAVTKGSSTLSGNNIVRFGWDGSLKGCFATKYRIRQIASDSERGKLFLLIENSEGFSLFSMPFQSITLPSC